MFFVINKDKIVLAFATICTVFALFLMTTIFAKLPEKTEETSAQNYSIENNTVQEMNNNI